MSPTLLLLILTTSIVAGEMDPTTTVATTVKIPIVNGALQVTLLTILLTLALTSNASVIINITSDHLKLKMLHFILIRHVCITDFIGALFILPLPIVVVAKGEWTSHPTICSAVSTTTAACWTMHLIAVAMYRADRVLAVWLPTGRYPVLSVKSANFVLMATWAIALTGSYCATLLFGPTFQPALALCIPDVPLIFFITLFSGYCIGLVSLTTGYLLAFVRRRRKKRRIKSAGKNGGNSVDLEFGAFAPFEPEPGELMEKVVVGPSPARPRSHSDQPKSSPMLKSHRRGLSESHHTPPELLSPSSALSYSRLQEEDAGSCEFKLTHSVSLDDRKLGKKSSSNILLGSRRSLDDGCYNKFSVDESLGSSSSSNGVMRESCIVKGSQIVPGSQLPPSPIVTEVITEMSQVALVTQMTQCVGINSQPTPVLNTKLNIQTTAITPMSQITPSPLNSTQLSYKPKHRKTKSSSHRALASYAVSVGHLLLYLPAMFVIGMNRGRLPPATALLCGLVIYCEFIIQPIALLLISQRLRVEVCRGWWR